MKSTSSWMLRAITGVAALLVFGCGGGTPITFPPPHMSSFTWVSGTNSTRSAGVYGTQGTASPSNVPGARQFPSSWTDNSGNLWLFGGNGVDSAGAGAFLNDL